MKTIGRPAVAAAFGVTLSLILAVALPTLAVAATATLVPTGCVTRKGGAVLQPLANLAAQDQTGKEDDPAKYVLFSTPRSIYLGYLDFFLPADVPRDAATALVVRVNYKGYTRAAQTWGWSLYDWSAGRWVLAGDNRAVRKRVWTGLAFAPANIRRFIEPASGRVSLRLRSSNDSGNAKIDYLAIDLAYVPQPQPGDGPTIGGCPLFPADNFWNTPVDALPVHPKSAAWVRAIGTGGFFHMDFGSGLWEGSPIGIPPTVVPAAQPAVPVTFDEYGEESDPGPYPLPPDPAIEGGSDHHVLLVRQEECRLFELYHAHREEGAWYAGSGATWDLASDALRPAGWTSSDLAGMPILPGLARYEEVLAGGIRHALRFTAEGWRTAEGFIWPARHPVPDLQGSYATIGAPPMGARFRLKASFAIPDDAPAEVQVLLRAMKTYGIVLADHGSNWFVGGAPDERWDNDALHRWFDEGLRGGDFEAVDTALLMQDPDSGAAVAAPPAGAPSPAAREAPIRTRRSAR